MNELNWYVQIVNGSDRRAYWFFRAYSLQEVKTELLERWKRLGYYETWSVFPLEKDGAYWDGTQFLQCENLPAGFEREVRG